MVNYQPFMSIYVEHEYYNTSPNHLAPITLIPSRETLIMLTQMGVLLKSGGVLHLIADTARFNEVVAEFKNLPMQLFLLSHHPGLRSVTKMPNEFDVSLVDTTIKDQTELAVPVETWLDKNEYIKYISHNSVETFDANLIGIVNATLDKEVLTLKNKSLTIKYETMSAIWKYYFLKLDTSKTYQITDSSNFTTFTPSIEQLNRKDIVTFTSDRAIALHQTYTATYALNNDRKVIVKSLPVAETEQLSAIVTDNGRTYLSHIYIN
ncbi:hypothetical protein F9817_06915 [Vibrio sp. CAIM 722]|uniref:Uncharacterized protein n=1 Tax=Vibrio eleionomae TaxID=2653505 RepID=A0A7X4LJX4_9VIBR|nr:hypothetical protein [Vibrio eleionomae]MZI92926.1 hypothetical protein [Vibrio eleionomae]